MSSKDYSYEIADISIKLEGLIEAITFAVETWVEFQGVQATDPMKLETLKSARSIRLKYTGDESL